VYRSFDHRRNSSLSRFPRGVLDRVWRNVVRLAHDPDPSLTLSDTPTCPLGRFLPSYDRCCLPLEPRRLPSVLHDLLPLLCEVQAGWNELRSWRSAGDVRPGGRGRGVLGVGECDRAERSEYEEGVQAAFGRFHC
jgi:hypothetical protein